MKRPKRNIDKSVKQSNTRRNYDTELFKWSFKDCFYEHQSWGTLGACDLIVEIIHKLESYETQIWTDLKNASGGKRDKGGSNNHFIDATKLPNSLRKEYIRRNLMESYDRVFSLRLTGTKRLIGYVRQGVFYILWYDPNHQIFPCSI